MSHDIIKKISFEDNKVKLLCAPSNVYPIDYEWVAAFEETKLFREKGKEAALQLIGERFWDGLYELKKTDHYCNLFHKARNFLPENMSFHNFDGESVGKFLGSAVLKLEVNPKADLSKDVDALLELKNNKEHIFSVAKKTGQNLTNFASEEIQKDREFAYEVLRAAEGHFMYDYPNYFKEDKEFAMEALRYNGCLYRALDDSLKYDKEIVLLAFDNSQNRKYHEHLPNLIPHIAYLIPDEENGTGKYDFDFIFQLIEVCPSLHIDRAKWLLQDHDVALHAVKYNKWTASLIKSLPEEFLSLKEIQDELINKGKDEKEKNNIRDRILERGVPLVDLSLKDKINYAKKRQENGPATDPKSPDREI